MDQKSTINSVDTGFNCAVFKLPFPTQHKIQCLNPLRYSLVVNRMKTIFAQRSNVATPSTNRMK